MLKIGYQSDAHFVEARERISFIFMCQRVGTGHTSASTPEISDTFDSTLLPITSTYWILVGDFCMTQDQER
jgi:hypothetical protein